MAYQESRYRFLIGATKGTMFMGVPHTGADEARLAAVVANIARLSFNVNRAHLDDLNRGSRFLQELARAFSQLEGFDIITVCESEKTPISIIKSVHVGLMAYTMIGY